MDKKAEYAAMLQGLVDGNVSINVTQDYLREIAKLAGGWQSHDINPSLQDREGDILTKSSPKPIVAEEEWEKIVITIIELVSSNSMTVAQLVDLLKSRYSIYSINVK